MARERRHLLVTGTPRSGTLSVAGALAAMGLEVGHETMGADGSVSSLIAFPAEDAGRRDLGTHLEGGLEGFEFSTVARTVRDPLETVASIAYLGTPGLARFAASNLVHDAPRFPPLELAARTWLAWDRELERHWGPFPETPRTPWSRFRIRVEDLPKSLGPLAELLGLEVPRGRFHAHQSQRAKLTWRQLGDAVPDAVYCNVRDRADLWGYL
jgi:hypothetical protein